MVQKIFIKAVRSVRTRQYSQSSRLTRWLKNHKKRIKIVILLFLGLVVSFSLTVWYMWDEPLLSPLSPLTTFRFLKGLSKPKPPKIVYGFLPYWNLSQVIIHPEITHLAYFSLTIGPDGYITTQENGGTEPGFNKLKSDKLMELINQVSSNKDQVEIVLTQFNNDDIVALTTNPEAHQNLITSLDSILLAYPVSGINIDIEYTGEVTNSLRQQFAELIRTINQHLDSKFSSVQLSIDMYASAAGRNLIWDVAKIGSEVDYIVVMAYDFHRRSSPQAGPVAPLFGGNKLWESDINQNLKEFLSFVDKDKILLGIPFYGYEWQTTSQDPQAHTYPDTGATASYKRVQELLAQQEALGVEEHWHEIALSPYLTYTEDDENYIVYYENARSIAYKLEYVNQLDLAGIAIWALGYEGNTRELWDMIGSKL